MNVDTTRFGAIEVQPDDLVVFPDGLPGFAGRREMVVISGGDLLGAEPGDDHPTLLWLQDVADPDLAFLTTVPWSAYPDYDIDPELDPKIFADTEADDVCVLSIVTVRRNGDAATLTSNLLAPIIIDERNRVGMQVILEDSGWPLQAPLAESRPAGAL